MFMNYQCVLVYLKHTLYLLQLFKVPTFYFYFGEVGLCL